MNIRGLQMSDGGQIQQQNTISSFLFTPQHQLKITGISFNSMQYFQAK
jgi:hypothetical protein